MPSDRLQPNALVWLLVSVAVLGIDQATKQWAIAMLPEHTAVPVFEGWWNWYRAYNSGAAFSLLSGASGWQRPALTLLAASIALVLTRLLRHTPRNAWLVALPYALIIGGALGNAIDRVVHGHVVDFIGQGAVSSSDAQNGLLTLIEKCSPRSWGSALGTLIFSSAFA